MTDRPGEGPLRHVAAFATAGAAVVHVAAVPVHLEEDTTHGVAFVVMAVALGVAAASAWLGRGRAGLVAVAVTNAAVLGLWWWTRTIGLPGEGVEAVEVTDAMAVALEAAGLAAAVGALAAISRAGASRWRVLVPVGALALVAAAVVPAVATAGDHQHDDPAVHTAGATGGATAADHPHESDGTAASVGESAPAVTDDPLLTSSISRVFAGVPADHAHSGGTGNAHFEDQDGPCTPSADEVAAADRLITDTMFALLAFADPEAAVDAGYRPLGFEPNGVHHYINAAYRSDGRTLDPSRPESILYGRTPDGGLFPVGVMFMMGEQGEAGPRVGGCLTPWHTHGPPFAPRGQVSAEMMHVWTVPVPGGAFAEHVEGEYARLYLGVEPVDADRLLQAPPRSTSSAAAPPALGTTGGPAATAAPGEPAPTALPTTTGAPTTTKQRRPVSITEVLNALNVHRELLCSDGVRPRLEQALQPDVVDRICDPILNGPLPGATAPPVSELEALFESVL